MKLLPRRVLPVLMYHRFGTPTDGDPELWVSMEQFAAQIRWLKEHNFHTLSLEEAHTALTTGKRPHRSVLLTIDDGFAEDLERAADLLSQAGFRAAVFVPAGLLGQQVKMSHPTGDQTKTSAGEIVDSDGLGRWLERGFDVGCHSMTHPDLTTSDAGSLRTETLDSRNRLSELLDRPIDDFCYPFAHHNQAVRQTVEAAGYRAAYAGEPPREDLFAVPRMMVYPSDDESRFQRKVSGYYFWMSSLHQKLRRFMGN